MDQTQGVKEGMTVRSMDGHKLGKVYAVSEREFFIEKGIFFPKDYSVRFGEVSEIRDGSIILAHGQDSLRSFSDAMLYNSNLPASDDTVATEDQRLEGLRTEDLGEQEVGPYNTEGASASPFLTEEDRGLRGTRPLKPALRPPPMGRAVEPRPAMSASDEGPFINRNMEDDVEQERRLQERRDGLEGDSRRLDLSSVDDPARRGY